MPSPFFLALLLLTSLSTMISHAWAEDSPAFEITDSSQEKNISVIARYPNGTDPLLSGWLLGGKLIEGKAAMVEVKVGKGSIVLFGFRPQYRGQAMSTYPLIWGAVLQ